jgi:tetratricopeptide (TPR) repeat protein
VSLRLVAAGELLDEEPELALAHALVARRLASRIPAVREAVGLAAYRAGQWQTAIGELRAYHRMSGQLTHLAVLADCERALGRPERAIDIFRTADRAAMTPHEATELLIVAAGARADMGQRDAAVAMLQARELTSDEPWAARLRYAYADALLNVGRRDEAREWFARAAEIDEDATTDAAERLLDLDGVVLDDSHEPDAGLRRATAEPDAEVDDEDYFTDEDVNETKRDDVDLTEDDVADDDAADDDYEEFGSGEFDDDEVEDDYSDDDEDQPDRGPDSLHVIADTDLGDENEADDDEADQNEADEPGAP